jgi:predicted outer membrane repeat protein
MQHQLRLPRWLHALIPLLLLGLLALSPATPLRAAGVIYVVPGGAGAQTGADWFSAKELQAALQSATSGDQIWVKAGTYKPTTSSDRGATFQLKSGVALYGGFAGSETNLGQRDPAAHVSVLSGDLLGNDSGLIASSNATRSDNSYHVVTSNGTDDTAILDGFTITSGNANGNIALRENLGGGIFSFQGSPRLCHIIVRRSSAKFGGGGIAYDEGNASICQATILDNTADDSGGGIFIRNGTNVVIYRTSLIENRAQIGGGIVPIAQHTIVSLSFLGGNTAEVGGGMTIGTGTVTISQAIFSGNTATSYGSAIASDHPNPTFSQVVFSNNRSLNNGGALSLQDSSPLIRNSIFWGNHGGQIHNYGLAGAPDVQYSLIQGGYVTGTQILDADPLFVDADGADNIAGTLDDDLRLQAGSPAIDAGNNAFIPSDLTDDNNNNDVNETAPFDLGGNSRLVGPTVDLGAYEWQDLPIPPKHTYLALISR